MAVAGLPRPLTFAGAYTDTREVEENVPLPSWPAPSAPQHQTDPSLSSAQPKSAPSDTAVAGAGRPVTSTGVRPLSVVLPVPSCSLKLTPQQRTVPSWRIAQVNS